MFRNMGDEGYPIEGIFMLDSQLKCQKDNLLRLHAPDYGENTEQISKV
jgi:hypothetical protein